MLGDNLEVLQDFLTTSVLGPFPRKELRRLFAAGGWIGSTNFERLPIAFGKVQRFLRQA